MPSSPLLPVGNYYVVIPDAPPQTAGHIVLNAAYQSTPRSGVIVAWGPETTELRNGDRCAWRAFAGTTVEIGAGRFLLVREDDIVCRLEPEET